MSEMTAGDLMVPLEKYPVIHASATVLEAVARLREFRGNMGSGRQPFQAVLVSDETGCIIGKMGQWSLLKALDPDSRTFTDKATLRKAGVSNTIMEAAIDHLRTFQCEFPEMCRGAACMPVSRIMQPIEEHIDIGAPLGEVIRRLVQWRSLSLLVTENSRPVGLVRLSDLCDTVMAEMHRAEP